MVSLSLLQLRSATVACIRLTLRCLCNDQGSQCHCLQTPPITCFLSSTQVSHTSCLYEHRPLKGLVLQPRSMWQLIFQVEKIHFNMCCWLKIFNITFRQQEVRATLMQPHILFSAPTIDEYDGQEAFLNETATTITVLLKPAQAKGAPIRYSTSVIC